jgi:HD domain-containing protein
MPGFIVPRGTRSKIQAAFAYAQRLHAGQSRAADGAPFIAHPREVAGLLLDAGAPGHVIAAGALHDVLEKTPACAAELRARFGAKIAGLVLAVSEDARIASYAARKTALRAQVAAAGEEALMLLAADKISKVRELRLTPARECAPEPSRAARGARDPRLVHYRRCLRLLQERLPDSPLVALLETELARVRAAGSNRARARGARRPPRSAGAKPLRASA